MRRGTTRDAAARAGVMVTRGTIAKANDDPKMQEVDVNGLHDETKTGVERFQNYGFSSVPLPPSKDDKGVMRHAEAIVLSGSGNRSHPIVIGVDDRRHRPKKLKPGESVFYDDLGQTITLTRDGIVISGGPSNKPVKMMVGGCTFKLSSEGMEVTGGFLKVNGHRVDETHKHTNVQPGGGTSGVPE